MNFNFVRYRKTYYIFSGIIVLASLFSLIKFGLKPGIDFTGGTILEFEYKGERPSNQAISESLSALKLGDISVQPYGEKGVILRMESIDDATHQQIVETLGDIEEKRFESIGPTVGLELKNKTQIVAVLAIAAMVLYIAFAFRKVSFPVSSWKYSAVTLIILSHDVLIPLGVFAVLGRLYGVQITIPVIVAFLTVIGYAINNVVVVFDRIRENLIRRSAVDFEETVNAAINQTLSRQLNNSLTTLFPLIFIFTLGGETLKYFSLALILGLVAGTYSSIFLSGPILVSWLGFRKH
ncbi:MAG: protein translocase subunit SecF [Candidatus Pacebacteria bacterium]|nr:protein translocase subunit SecF [Candidatus Paceibacterota bacterium]